MRRVPAIALGLLTLAASAGFAQDLFPPSSISPTATTAADDAGQRLKLNLDQLIDIDQSFGHAEFNPAVRREMWRDPMVRLEYGVAREMWAAQRGGLAGSGIPWSISTSVMMQPGVSPRLIFAGPWAADWDRLTAQERIGRIAEGAVYAGIVAGIIAGLAHSLK